MDRQNEAIRWTRELSDGPLCWVEATTLAGIRDLVLPVRLRDASTRTRRGVVVRRRPGRGAAGFLDSSPGLFKAFARLEPTEERLLAFAQEWGYLGLWEDLASPAGSPPAAIGERLAVWRDAHRLVATGVRLWGALESGSDSGVRRALTTAHARSTMVDKLGESSDSAEILSLHVHLDALKDENGRPHFSFRTMPVEGKPIAETGRYLLGEYVDYFVSTTNTVRLRRAEFQECEYSTTFEPQNLWGAMWLSFALAIGGVTSIEECVRCHTVFIERVKSNKTHCDVCRKALSEERSALAKSLADGKPEMSEDEVVDYVLLRLPVDNSYRDRAADSVRRQIRKIRG